MNDDELLAEYKARRAAICAPLADRLSEHLRGNLTRLPRIDRIGARAKSPDRFLAKAAKARDDGSRKYEHPFEQIQDLVGARVIVFYLQDVEAVTAEIERYYSRIEIKDLIPESLSESATWGNTSSSRCPRI